ncbi:MAG TPA: ferrous iron transport protein B [Anaerolineales bacterium]|nr:ferrous iron transport protein B [Anaerolineales bacterium]
MNTPAASLTIALTGQPNVGKSTVFNVLTGLNQYVSNWPGKTCEQRIGSVSYNDLEIQVVDLPGTYCLTANSVEEQIARDYIIQGQPDVVAAVVDAASLERNLYLLAELLSLPSPLVLGLNRLDVAEQQGMRVEANVLEAALGIPVIAMVASKGQGVRELLDACVRVAKNPQDYTPNRPEIRADHKAVLNEIETLIAGHVPEPYPLAWVASKLLEGDDEVARMMQAAFGGEQSSDWQAIHRLLMQHEDAFLAVASGRYEWIGRMVRAAVVRPRPGQVTVTDRLDRLATHPTWGLLILLAALGVLFWLTYAIGAPLQAWLELHVVQAGAIWVTTTLNTLPAWLVGLLAQGIIAGVGTVLSLLPILIIFFIGLGVLEDLGYMARAAYVMDRYMHPMGLHGKSFLALFLGFGCNVPAVMGTRIIESPRARLLTILIAPLIPCTARLSVLVLLVPIFFGANAWWVTMLLIALPLGYMLLLGKGLHETALGGEHHAFIMELPLYQMPNLKEIGKGVWQRTMDFLQGAGTIILVVSVLMWGLSHFPTGQIESSYLAALGRGLAPVGQWMGLDWQMMVALLTSFVRKENTIPTLAVLYGAGQDGASLASVLGGILPPAAALAFLAVQVLFIPCVATVAAMLEETRSWRWTLLSVGLLLVISLLTGVLIYQGGRFTGWGI